MVDDEVKRLIDEAYTRAGSILSANRDLLDRLAAALLERETVDREDLDILVQGKLLPPRSSESAPPAAPAPPAIAKPDQTAARGPILGTPPPEPAGA
jgi:cell division protease FtsH